MEIFVFSHFLTTVFLMELQINETSMKFFKRFMNLILQN
ncbi:hypothetical protein THOG05_50216 [Vibrio rotiferianus]|nr:hypothetical protein THOG05_50216 [Vibrio rotiferianus]CAH1549760.1 hypothetical protein THOE12_10376 [Vibrio rotiferianus]CAH1590428.1 hypothetical protein THOG10_50185 [Vibrio rotiferianus]CAH1591832.1 hypothetical protein THOB06_50185 [Vibrio rotiferianus]